jgi:hypothetical protein
MEDDKDNILLSETLSHFIAAVDNIGDAYEKALGVVSKAVTDDEEEKEPKK